MRRIETGTGRFAVTGETARVIFGDPTERQARDTAGLFTESSRLVC